MMTPGYGVDWSAGLRLGTHDGVGFLARDRARAGG